MPFLTLIITSLLSRQTAVNDLNLYHCCINITKIRPRSYVFVHVIWQHMYTEMQREKTFKTALEMVDINMPNDDSKRNSNHKLINRFPIKEYFYYEKSLKTEPGHEN